MCVSEKYANNKNYKTNCCTPPGNITLTCKDSYGDGWNDGYIKIGGKEYCTNFSDQEYTEVTITGEQFNVADY